AKAGEASMPPSSSAAISDRIFIGHSRWVIGPVVDTLRRAAATIAGPLWQIVSKTPELPPH
ncbi:hypothetical protein, partial [Burkholderia gladioli]|uniref:hypothetical protein n=1 Tax=Burkholderia gladioli TaxID=28095 RepID=UPI003F795E0B